MPGGVAVILGSVGHRQGFAVTLPVAAFVAAGFEHSVANMYFIPAGIFLKTWAPHSAALNAHYPTITWQRFLFANLLPVTIGNIIGGAVFVGLVYWYIYLRTVPDRGG